MDTTQLENDKEKIKQSVVYKFADNENLYYPNRTTNPCDWCKTKFETSPLGIPFEFDPYVKKQISISAQTGYQFRSKQLWYDSTNFDNQLPYFNCFGIFCSFNCTLAYINKYVNVFDQSQFKINLKQLIDMIGLQNSNAFICDNMNLPLKDPNSPVHCENKDLSVKLPASQLKCENIDLFGLEPALPFYYQTKWSGEVDPPSYSAKFIYYNADKLTNLLMKQCSVMYQRIKIRV